MADLLRDIIVRTDEDTRATSRARADVSDAGMRPLPVAFEPDQLIDAFRAVYPAVARSGDDVSIVRAPGRVNLIGEHTDYNGGLVLPVAIDLEIRLAFVPTDDRHVELTRLDTGDRAGFHLDAIHSTSGSWIDYVTGTARALTAADLPISGIRGVVVSTLPENAGLASSAAIELATAFALLGDTAGSVDRMALAQICQRAENEYVGVQCGLMDQFAEACGVTGAALLLDCRSLSWQPVPLPGDVELVVCHSGSQRRLGASEYNVRRAQCEAAVAEFTKIDPSVTSLRDVSAATFEMERHRLDPVVARRAEHVIAENHRVEAAADALHDGELLTLGRLFRASHESLRDLFEVSSPELDALVDIAQDVDGVVGTRMTGAGFGGCTISLVRREAIGALRDAILAEYRARTGLSATVLPVSGADGVSRFE